MIEVNFSILHYATKNYSFVHNHATSSKYTNIKRRLLNIGVPYVIV